ncbi:hypothetical protein WJU16_22520 [Chitinophaga pollutisoli]|uniref:Zinc-finger domain-containing protein n=1 Tax=Chitinophaga pollutisoli TaxID=3133966 RepID=A0ABZ2YLW3_9BACT
MNNHPSDNEIQEYVLFPPGEVHAHIANCPLCQEKAQRYRQLTGLLSAHATVVPDFKLADRVMARLTESRQPAPRRVKSENIAIVASGLTGLGAIVFAGWITGFFAGLAAYTFAIMAAGSLLLLGFLLVVQLRGYRKIMQITEKETFLQPN